MLSVHTLMSTVCTMYSDASVVFVAKFSFLFKLALSRDKKRDASNHKYLFLLHFCLMKNWIHIGLRLCPWSEKHTFGASYSLRYILFLGGLFLGLLPWQHSRFQKVCCHPHSQWENKCKIHLPWQCSYSRQILGRSCRWTSGHTYGWNKRSSHKHILPIR